MSERKRMYYILQEMLDNASRNNEKGVRKLNRFYESLVEKNYADPPTDLDLKYDRCRISCLVCFSMPWMKDKLIFDAKKRFSSIPDPEKESFRY